MWNVFYDVPMSRFCLVFLSQGLSEFIQRIGQMRSLVDGCFLKVICVFLGSSQNLLDSESQKHPCNGREHQCGASEWRGLHLRSSAGPRNPSVERDHEKGQLLDLCLLYVASSCFILLILIFSSKLDNFSLGKVWNQGAVCPEGVLSKRWRGHAKASFCRARSWRWEACALLRNKGLCYVLF